VRKVHSLSLAQILLAGICVGVIFLTSACGGDSHVRQEASQVSAQLDQQIHLAEVNGVPASALQPILQQEQALKERSAPFTMFDDTPANLFYTDQTAHYRQLLSQLQEQVAIVTGQDQGQAQQDLANFQQALGAQQAKKAGNLAAFSLQYTVEANRLAAARSAKDFLTISDDTRTALSALQMMASTSGQLIIFRDTIAQMRQANLDVTAMQSQYTSDLDAFNSATTVSDFTTLATILNAQYQLAVVNSIQSLPYVGAAKLQEFQDQINDLRTYGMDASAYVKLYTADKASMVRAQTISDYLAVSNRINVDMASMHADLVQGESWYLIKKLDRDANAWGQAHLYHDKFNGKNYILDSGYTMNGIGYWLQRENGWSYTTADYESVVNDDLNEFFNFQMFQLDYADTSPSNQPRQTDLLMMQHYPSLTHGTVIMVATAEEYLRFYVDGKLVNSFPVTTGRVERPTLPGVWLTQDRKSPTEFKSDDPPTSPFWYPPTPIHYAILYHWGGFFVHDAWWRADYGMGTQFPHYDSGGDESFAGDGSHGCVNVREDRASWLYAHTNWNTQIVIY